MALDTKHPLWADNYASWFKMRDLYAGSAVIKGKGVEYLPPTPGMLLDGISLGQVGLANYTSYKARAIFPEYVKEGVEALIGMLHRKETVIELPAKLELIRENATQNGETLIMLLRRIHEEQLVSGRLGLLLDFPSSGVSVLPYLTTYAAETVTNWNEANDDASGVGQLNFVVLNESGYRFNPVDFTWDTVSEYRVLELDPEGGNYQMGLFTEYGTGNSSAPAYTKDAMGVPMARGQALEQLPFTFINSKDIVPTPDRPPLMALGDLSLTIYQGEADYRQSLFMQGQDTLVVIGGVSNPEGLPGEDDAIRTGAGSRIDVNAGGDAKYIGVASTGLAEQRMALENDHSRAEQMAGQLATRKAAQAESGSSLQTRQAAQTATLIQIAQAAAAGLEKVLRIAAEWVGANPDEVKVTPNLEFGHVDFNPRELVDLMTAKTMGAPISSESIHAFMVKKGVTNLDYETESSKAEDDVGNEIPPVTGQPPVDNSDSDLTNE